jgi:hypothetical protein
MTATFLLKIVVAVIAMRAAITCDAKNGRIKLRVVRVPLHLMQTERGCK